MHFILKGSTQTQPLQAPVNVFNENFKRVYKEHVHAALARGRAGQGLFKDWKSLTWDGWPASRDPTPHACLHCSDRSMRPGPPQPRTTPGCSWKELRGGPPNGTIYAC